MALTFSQVAVSSSATSIVTLPPGGVIVLIASAATQIGSANTVTTSTGFTLPANVPVTLSFVDEGAASGVTLWGVTGSTSNVNYALNS